MTSPCEPRVGPREWQLAPRATSPAGMRDSLLLCKNNTHCYRWIRPGVWKRTKNCGVEPRTGRGEGEGRNALGREDKRRGSSLRGRREAAREIRAYALNTHRAQSRDAETYSDSVRLEIMEPAVLRFCLVGIPLCESRARGPEPPPARASGEAGTRALARFSSPAAASSASVRQVEGNARTRTHIATSFHENKGCVLLRNVQSSTIWRWFRYRLALSRS